MPIRLEITFVNHRRSRLRRTRLRLFNDHHAAPFFAQCTIIRSTSHEIISVSTNRHCVAKLVTSSFALVVRAQLNPFSILQHKKVGVTRHSALTFHAGSRVSHRDLSSIFREGDKVTRLLRYVASVHVLPERLPVISVSRPYKSPHIQTFACILPCLGGVVVGNDNGVSVTREIRQVDRFSDGRSPINSTSTSSQLPANQ